MNKLLLPVDDSQGARGGLGTIVVLNRECAAWPETKAV